MKIAYVGPYLSTAPGSAGMQRALGVSMSLTAAGADVSIGTADVMGTPVPSEYSNLDGIHITHLRQPSVRMGSIRKAMDWFTFGRRIIAWLQDIARPDFVILYGGGASAASAILRWSRDARVPVAVDVVEWHDPTHQPLGWLGPFAYDLELGMRRAYPQAGNIIGISSFIQGYYERLGCNTVLVPPTVDVASSPWNDRASLFSDPLRLAYAGSPGRKDNLVGVADGIELAQAFGGEFILDVVGPSADELKRILERPVLPTWIHCHGRMPRADAISIVSDADYVPLLRPNKRSSNAGFSTKVVESLTLGTPVIANITSDLAGHVLHGKTGWVARDSSAEGFSQALLLARELSRDKYQEMRQEARRHAERAFDFRRYTDELASFIAVGRSAM